MKYQRKYLWHFSRKLPKTTSTKIGNKIIMTLLMYTDSKYCCYLLAIASLTEMIDLISISPLAQEMKLCAS